MNLLPLHEYHREHGAQFRKVRDADVVAHYGDMRGEYDALRKSVGILDLSSRGRLCLVGEDRQRFLNGQVTNDVAALRPGQGCYAALITAKGKMLSDLNVYVMQGEILLDFEPGIAANVTQRLEKFIIADDVQVIDAVPSYGLLSVQGPTSSAVLKRTFPDVDLPIHWMHFIALNDPALGEMYIMQRPRTAAASFDIFVPVAGLQSTWEKLIQASQAIGGCACGWEALEMLRIEAGIPRYGADMDETNLPPEAGLEASAISYKKGCYIGQEVIARIRTYGQVAKTLRGLKLSGDLASLPQKGDRLFAADKEVGYLTSAIHSPALGKNIALGYVRRESNQIGAELRLQTATGEGTATIVELPFARNG